MQDPTNPMTPSTHEDDSTSPSPPQATRARLRGVTLALAFSLVAAGCAAETGAEAPTSDDAPVAASEDGTETSDDTTNDEPTTDTGDVERLEDVASGNELVEIEPGLYTGDLLDGLVLSVPEGVGVIPPRDRFRSYFFEGVERDGAAFVLPITGVVPADRVGSPVATEEIDKVLTDVPDDLGPYFEEIPQLEVLDSGETGTYRWWDIQVRPELGDVHSECGPPGMECISLFGEPTGAVTLNTMTGWMPRVVQPIATPSVLLWAAGQDGTIGPSHELTLELAEGFE